MLKNFKFLQAHFGRKQEHGTPKFFRSPSFIFTYPENVSLLVQAVTNLNFGRPVLAGPTISIPPNFVLSKPLFTFAYHKNFVRQSRVNKKF